MLAWIRLRLSLHLLSLLNESYRHVKKIQLYEPLEYAGLVYSSKI